MNRPKCRRLASCAIATAAVAGTATGCGSTGTSSSPSHTYVVWDPYPQFDENSPWAALLSSCGTTAGVKVVRNTFDTGEMADMLEAAVPQDAQPDVLILDNPTVTELAGRGLLTTTTQNGIDTSAVQANLLAAGRDRAGVYGTPIGANTLALYYNKKILQTAGVDISTVKDWASLTDALAKVSASGKQGITFVGSGSEEETFQFLPWFWGSGAQLTKLDSAQATSALSLWTDWIHQHYTTKVTDIQTQAASWKDFQTGQVAFAENGTWQLPSAKQLPFGYGIIPMPAKDGGDAPVPLGGEFVTIPAQKNTSRYAISNRIVTCLTSADNSYATDTTLSYIAPVTAVQTKQVTSDPALAVWKRAVQDAKGRTSDNLGAKYPTISQALSNAVSTALTGNKTPQAALAAAQSSATAAK
jgi:multiple sugar transport system substrate-binding protein